MSSYRVTWLAIAAAAAAALAGCTNTEGGNDGGNGDATQALMFEPFTSVTWSLSRSGNIQQLSITDTSGAAACAAAQDHRNSLPTGGSQIILRLATDPAGVCPVGNYPITANCALNLGGGPHVAVGCAYYRKWSPQGASLGIAAAINGEVMVAGSDQQCTIRANVGFLGGSFAQMLTLTNGAAAQPWCGT